MNFKRHKSWVSVKMDVCYSYFCIPRTKIITFKQDNVYFMLQVTIRFQIFPKSLRTLSKGQSEFCVTNHNDLESSFGGLYDTFKHILSLLLLSSWLRRTRWIYFVSDSIMRFIWVMRIVFKWTLFPPTLILSLHFFHGARQTVWLFWFQRLWESSQVHIFSC